MTIHCTLNGEEVTFNANADERLITILRETFSLTNAKCGCLTGNCGACSVIFNHKVVKACLIPAFQVRGNQLTTIEGFAHTDEYQDIVQGFADAGARNCGYCDAGKILTVETLLAQNPHPSRLDILAGFNGIRCRCTEPDSLIEGVLAAASIRQRRLYGRAL
jgi:carbon-monoxide dehydrogenase small subunit